MLHPEFQNFLDSHHLPSSYVETTLVHFQAVIDDCRQRLAEHAPIVLGINGCQGSGKSTLAAFLQCVFETHYALNVVNLSLDDFYLSKQARQAKADSIHPLLATRGVPGTHDMYLALDTLQQLIAGNAPLIPRFNKATDDPFPQAIWTRAPKKVDIVIIEGWCLNALPEDESRLSHAINKLEQEHDQQGIWRRYVNTQLKTSYPALFALVDCLVMLKAPSFNSVFAWRLEQENKLAKKLQSQQQENTSITFNRSGLMSEKEIGQFIQFFQRLTEHMLAEMPDRADHCYFLDSKRQILHAQHNTNLSKPGDPDIH